jgi:hypothetical protein
VCSAVVFNLFTSGSGTTLLMESMTLGGTVLGALLDSLIVCKSIITSLLVTLTLDGTLLTLALDTLRGNQTLDLWSLGLWLLTIADDLATDNILAHIICRVKVEQLADVRSTLWSETARHDRVGKTWDLGITLLDNNKVEDRQIVVHDATANRLALALTTTADTVARVVLGEKKTHTLVGEDTLHHRETLLVVTTGDTEDVTLELVTENITVDLMGHTLIEEDTSIIVLNLNEFLVTRDRVADVKLCTERETERKKKKQGGKDKNGEYRD